MRKNFLVKNSTNSNSNTIMNKINSSTEWLSQGKKNFLSQRSSSATYKNDLDFGTDFVVKKPITKLESADAKHEELNQTVSSNLSANYPEVGVKEKDEIIVEEKLFNLTQEEISVSDLSQKKKEYKDKVPEASLKSIKRTYIKSHLSKFRKEKKKEAKEKNIVLTEEALRNEWKTLKKSNKMSSSSGMKKEQEKSSNEVKEVKEIKDFATIIQFLLNSSTDVPIVRQPKMFKSALFYFSKTQVKGTIKNSTPKWEALSSEKKKKYEAMHSEDKVRFEQRMKNHSILLERIHKHWSSFYFYLLDMKNSYQHELTPDFLNFCRLKWVNSAIEFTEPYTSKLNMEFSEFEELFKIKNQKLKSPTTIIFSFVKDVKVKVEKDFPFLKPSETLKICYDRWSELGKDEKLAYSKQYFEKKKELHNLSTVWREELKSLISPNSSKRDDTLTKNDQEEGEKKITITKDKKGKKLVPTLDESHKKKKKK